jgi:hypothetical protein
MKKPKRVRKYKDAYEELGDIHRGEFFRGSQQLLKGIPIAGAHITRRMLFKLLRAAHIGGAVEELIRMNKITKKANIGQN